MLQSEFKRCVFLNLDGGVFFNHRGSYPQRHDGQPTRESDDKQGVEPVVDDKNGVLREICANWNRRDIEERADAFSLDRGDDRRGEEDQTGPPRDSPPSPQQTVPSPSRQDGSVEFIVVKDGVGVCERGGYWRLLIDVGLLISDIGCPFVGFGCPFDDVGRLLIRRNLRTRGWRRSCLFVFYC